MEDENPTLRALTIKALNSTGEEKRKLYKSEVAIPVGTQIQKFNKEISGNESHSGLGKLSTHAWLTGGCLCTQLCTYPCLTERLPTWEGKN